MVSFLIGKNYHDQEWCDVATMDACYILLGKPWLYDNKVTYDGFKHTYAFENDDHKIVLVHLKPNLNALHAKRKVSHLLLNGGNWEEVNDDHQVIILKDIFNGDISMKLQSNFYVMPTKFGVLSHGLHKRYVLWCSLHMDCFGNMFLFGDVIKDLRTSLFFQPMENDTGESWDSFI